MRRRCTLRLRGTPQRPRTPMSQFWWVLLASPHCKTWRSYQVLILYDTAVGECWPLCLSTARPSPPGGGQLTRGVPERQARGDARCRRHRTVQTSLDNPLRGWWQESPNVPPGAPPEQAGPQRPACSHPAAVSWELRVIARPRWSSPQKSKLLLFVREASACGPLMLSRRLCRLRAAAMPDMLPGWLLRLRMRGR